MDGAAASSTTQSLLSIAVGPKLNSTQSTKNFWYQIELTLGEAVLGYLESGRDSSSCSTIVSTYAAISSYSLTVS